MEKWSRWEDGGLGLGDAVKGISRAFLQSRLWSSSSFLPPAPAAAGADGRGNAAASSVPAAGLVMAQLGLCLPAAVAAIVVAVVLLVKRHRSRHPARPPESSSWLSSFCCQTYFVCCLQGWLVFKSRWIECYIIMQCQLLPLPRSATKTKRFKCNMCCSCRK